MVRVAIILIVLMLAVSPAWADGRFALLIGNQSYAEKVGPLKNPHNDIALVGDALRKLGFKTTLLKDAGYRAIDTALRRHIHEVRRAGKDTISFVYYSGHGAADPDTQINYLIPVDVSTADDSEIWTNSHELRGIVDRLRDQSPDATHFVVFDACRDELRLTRDGKKALPGTEKGFVAVGNISGVMIAYATAPGKTASDRGESGGPYAKALAEEIVKPGIESVMMFRNVQLRVKQEIGQDPWLSFPTLPAVYFAGTKPPGPTREEQLEMAFWISVKDSTSPAVLATYLERYPDGEFAPIAHALVEHYEQRFKAELAAREEERRRQEEARREAEVKRLEDERRMREAALTEERKRAEEGKNVAGTERLEEQQRAELAARTEELRKALDEARMAREGAKVAEEQRLAAVKAAEEATRQAEQSIALKRDSERHGDPTKIAALPKLEKPQSSNSFDGTWAMVRLGQNCASNRYTPMLFIKSGVISGHLGAGGVRGSVSATGEFRLTHLSNHSRPGETHHYSGSLRGNSGSGTFSHSSGACRGTFSLTRR